MGLFGDILGSAVGVLGDIWSTDRANDAQFDLQRQSYEYQKESMQNRHQWEVEDLRKAGLNPILSATNSAGGVISTGAGQAAKADVSKALSSVLTAFTNSAIGQNSIKISNKDADSRRIDAEANMIRAQNDLKKTPSSIALQESQTKLNLYQMEYLDKNYELQKAYNDANVSKIYQDIANSVVEVQARVKLYEQQGEAALTSAAGAYNQGLAALSNSDSQRIIAEVAEKNGVSQRELNDVLRGKADAETYEALQRVGKIASERAAIEDKRELSHGKTPYLYDEVPKNAASWWYQFSDMVSNIVPLKFTLGD